MKKTKKLGKAMNLANKNCSEILKSLGLGVTLINNEETHESVEIRGIFLKGTTEKIKSQ